MCRGLFIMRIDFECSGGFANLRIACHAESGELPRQLAEEVLRLVEESGFFDIRPGEVVPSSAGPPDVFLYSLSISEGARKNALVCNDVTAPARLHPLLALLRDRASHERRKGK